MGRQTPYLQQVNRAIDCLVSQRDQPLRLAQLAETAGISPFHLHRVFRALVGQTPAEFGRRVRLEKALRLMAFTRNRSLTAIALDCGFQSSSDFSRSFKNRYGTSPRSFDIEAWRAAQGQRLDQSLGPEAFHVRQLPSRGNPDAFKVKIRELPPRQVAYIRVQRPYQGNRVMNATDRLMAWAEKRGLQQGQWLGYQWDNPEITALDDCQYFVAVEAPSFRPEGEVGCFQFPQMTVAEMEIRGGIDFEVRALRWLYGSWLPRSRYVPDDHPGFESWIGRPYAHGNDYFELHLQLPVRQA